MGVRDSSLKLWNYSEPEKWNQVKQRSVAKILASVVFNPTTPCALISKTYFTLSIFHSVLLSQARHFRHLFFATSNKKKLLWLQSL